MCVQSLPSLSNYSCIFEPRSLPKGWLEEYARRLTAGVYRVQDAPELNEMLEYPGEHPRVVTRFPQATLGRRASPSLEDVNGEKATTRSGVETPTETLAETSMDTHVEIPTETPAETTVFEAVTRWGRGGGGFGGGCCLCAQLYPGLRRNETVLCVEDGRKGTRDFRTIELGSIVKSLLLGETPAPGVIFFSVFFLFRVP